MAGIKTLVTALLACSLLSGVTAHPGEEHSAEKVKKGIAARGLAESHAKRVTTRCSGTAKHAALQSRAAARRAVAAQLLREKRGIVDKTMVSKRDQPSLDKWLNTCHDMSGTHSDYDASTPEAAIFTSNATHALTPETIIGPYFVAGEYIRSNVAEEQAGVPIHLDIQFVDVATCEAVPHMLVDIWHANATGFYSGIGETPMGTGTGGLNTTFLRGVQVTDHDGVVQFDSVFPGHYLGRTNHVHVVSRRGGRLLDNGTYAGGTVNHIGQLYFDQELVGMVEAMDPYARNAVPPTTNRDDFFTPDEAAPDYDPFVDYVMLSDDANDGLLMWITIGVNTTADYDTEAFAAATWQKGGGVAAPMPSFAFPPPFPLNGTATAPGPTGGLPPPMGGFPPPPPGGFPGFPSSSAAAGSRPTPKPWGPCF